MKNTRFTSIFIIMALMVSFFGFSANAQTTPTIISHSVEVTGPHNAIIHVRINPNGSATNISFRYWTGSLSKISIYGNVNGTSPVDTQNWGLMRLFEGTTYSYQITVGGTSVTGNFTTTGGNSTTSTTTNTNTSSGSQGAPLVTTNGPSSILANSAVINGSVNPNGNTTTFWFEFGSTQSLGQNTTTQSLGSGNGQTIVTGNLTNLQNATYYYRAVAQNSYGKNYGVIWYFNTGTGQTGMVSGQSNGQVLGSTTSNTGSVSGTNTVTTGGTTNSTTGGTKSSATSSGTVKPKSTAPTPPNTRPSFISLEYSLGNDGALVLVADEAKPKPGEDFTYTVVYKNDSAYDFNEPRLKVIVPSEAYYVSSNIEPINISGNIVEFNLEKIKPGDRGEISVVVKIREDVVPGTNMIFTSVLTYKDRLGTQLATTSYMTVKTGQMGSALSASLGNSFLGSTGMLLLIALSLLILFGILTYAFVKIRKRNGNNNKDEFGLSMMPATFEPVGSGVSFKK